MRVRHPVQVDAATHRLLKQAARRERRTMQDVVRRAIRAYAAAADKTPPTRDPT